MFGNWKLAATFRPLGRLRWLMEGSRPGYLRVALSAKRSAIGLHLENRLVYYFLTISTFNTYFMLLKNSNYSALNTYKPIHFIDLGLNK